VLIVDHYVPQPDRDAGSRTLVAFIDVIQRLGFIVKFWPDNLWYDPIYTPQLQQCGVEVFYGPEYVGKFSECIQQSNDAITHVLLSRPHISINYLEALEKLPDVRVAYYGHDLHFDRLENEYAVNRKPEVKVEADRFRAMETMIWAASDVVLYPSDDEVAKIKLLDATCPALAISPYIYADVDRYRKRHPVPGQTILFVAGFGHPPNADAARWFVENVFPLVRKQHPGVELKLIGSNPSPEVKALAGDAIEVTGYVTDAQLLEYYATARVAVVPLRYGAGIKNKVVEAMAYGVPLVTTEVGAQGLEGLDAIVPVTSDPVVFASHVCAVLTNDDIWRNVSQQGAGFVARRFSADAMARTMAEALAADHYIAK